MIKISFGKSKTYIHFFNTFSIYWCGFEKTEKTEYWAGHRRKRIFKAGKFTFWLRWNHKITKAEKKYSVKGGKLP